MRPVDARKLRSGIGVLALSACSGCYGYINSEPETIEPGEQVRVVLSDLVPGQVSPALMRRASTLEGDLIRLTTDSAALSVWIGQGYRGTQFGTAHQTVSLPRGQIVGFQRRELSKWRTVLAAAAVVGAAVALIREVGFSEDPNPGGNTVIPPPPPGGGGGRFVVPGFRLFPIR